MEPTLHYGDLVVAKTQAHYRIGDLVVFAIGPNEVVVHRLVSGSASKGWTTKGDNNGQQDSWTVKNSGIMGRFWLRIPKLGYAFLWTRENPILFGLALTLTVLLIGTVARLRRPRIPPTLADAVSRGARLPRRGGKPVGELLLLAMSAFTTLISSIGLLVLVSKQLFLSPAALLSAIVFFISAVVCQWLYQRLVNGRGLAEPQASRAVLSAYCWDVESLPESDVVEEMVSARALRDLADRLRIPIIRVGSENEGEETYFTITPDGVGHRWMVRGGHDSAGDVEPSLLEMADEPDLL